MQSRSPLAFTMIAIISAGVTVAAINANAQPPGPASPPPPPSAERRGPHHAFSAADRAAFFDARVAALRAGLKLTPDQEKLWPPIEAALRAGAKSAAERHEKLRDEPPPADIIARLREISEAETAHGATLKAIADAASPLYATLSEEQKHRLPFLLHSVKAHFFGGHFRGMGEGPHHGWRGEGDEHGDFAGHDEDDDEGHPSEHE
jgi:zinc resistance-associated protein